MRISTYRRRGPARSLEQHASGINFIDTYFRAALSAPAGLPFVAGNEGAGEVIAVGPGVTDSRSATASATSRARRLCGRTPAAGRPRCQAARSICYEQAAGTMLKGMTAEYLLHRTFKVKQGTTVLIHAAAGGIGLIACQWANALGATVIGTVGSQGKGGPRQGQWLLSHDSLSRRGFRRPRQGDHRRRAVRRGL